MSEKVHLIAHFIIDFDCLFLLTVKSSRSTNCAKVYVILLYIHTDRQIGVKTAFNAFRRVSPF